jgi:hypothetical protein
MSYYQQQYQLPYTLHNRSHTASGANEVDNHNESNEPSLPDRTARFVTVFLFALLYICVLVMTSSLLLLVSVIDEYLECVLCFFFFALYGRNSSIYTYSAHTTNGADPYYSYSNSDQGRLHQDDNRYQQNYWSGNYQPVNEQSRSTTRTAWNSYSNNSNPNDMPAQQRFHHSRNA